MAICQLKMLIKISGNFPIFCFGYDLLSGLNYQNRILNFFLEFCEHIFGHHSMLNLINPYFSHFLLKTNFPYLNVHPLISSNEPIKPLQAHPELKIQKASLTQVFIFWIENNLTYNCITWKSMFRHLPSDFLNNWLSIF